MKKFMMMLIISMILVLLISSLLLFLGLLTSMKTSLDREKLSPFECGFTPKYTARLPFSIRFFLVAVMFLIFDVELLLLFPLIPALCSSHLFSSMFFLSVVIFILLLGLFYEIFQGSLSWAN